MMPPLVSSHFPSQFFRTLQQFRDSKYLCDVRLIADGEIEFPAHRLVLAISSPFFSDLFQSKKDAQDVTTVHLRNCSADCVQILLQFLYSGELQLKECDPGKVLSVARACRIQALEQMLASYVTSTPSPPASSTSPNKNHSPKPSNPDSPNITASSGQTQSHKRKSKHTVSADQQKPDTQQRKTSSVNKTTPQIFNQQQSMSGRLLIPPSIHPTPASSIFMQNTPALCPIHGVFGCTCPFANVVAATNGSASCDPSIAAAIQQLFFGAAAAAAAAAQNTDLSNDGHQDDDRAASGVAYGPPLPKIARTKASPNGLFMGGSSPNGDFHCQLPTTLANGQSQRSQNVAQTNSNSSTTSSTKRPSCDAQPTSTDDGQHTDRGSLNTVQVPADDKEGWCRNKKYIKKTPQGYQCTVCKKTYGRYNSVSYHVTIYHRNPPIQCDQPGCTFSTREARYIHFHKYYRHDVALPTNIDLESRRCPFCKHVAKSPAMLEKHINRHMPESIRVGRSYHCELCKKELANRHALVQHMLIHEQEKGLLACDQCSYRGRTPENLQQHKLFKHSHAGDLWCVKFQCDECQFTTPSKLKLSEHQRHVHCKEDCGTNSVSTTISDILKSNPDDEEEHENGSAVNLHSDSDEESHIDHDTFEHRSGSEEIMDEEEDIHGDDDGQASASHATTTDPSPETSD